MCRIISEILFVEVVLGMWKNLLSHCLLKLQFQYGLAIKKVYCAPSSSIPDFFNYLKETVELVQNQSRDRVCHL